MATPRSDCPDLYQPAAKIAAPGSASALFTPAVDVANHLLGHCLGGLRHHQVTPGTPSVTSWSGSFYTSRHPNCDHLFVWVRFLSAGNGAGITIQAGTGAATYRAVVGSGILEFVVPWGAADSGWNEVTVTTTNCGIKAIAVWDLPRSVLGSGDHLVEHLDATYPLAGFEAGRYLIESTSAGMKGLLTQSVYAWDDFVRSAVAWWTPNTPRSTAAAAWTNPFTIPGASARTWRHRARQRAAETARNLRVYAFTWCDGTVKDYEWRVTSATGSATSASLSHTSGAWTGSPVGNLPCYTTTDDTLTFEMRVTGGSGNVYVSRLTIGEDR